jgi:sugar lactone lactonase YvrE
VIIVLALISAALIAWYWWMRTRPPGLLITTVTLAGDGPQIASSSLSDPFGIAVDQEGNIYASDGRGGRIHRFTKTGELQTVSSGLEMPSGLALTRDGALIVAETGAHTIISIDLKTGEKRVIAGTPKVSGYADGAANAARFNGPVGVAVDKEGTIFVADTYNDRIRAIDRHGQVRTIAGGDAPDFHDGQGTEARFDTPCGIAVTNDNVLIVADTGNHRLRRVTLDGNVATLAGNGEREGRDGALSEATFDEPTAIAVRRDGALAIADAASSKLRLLTFGEQPQVRTLVGGYPFGWRDGTLENTLLNRPTGLAFDPDDALVFADSENGVIRALFPRGESRPARPPLPDPPILAAAIRAAVPPRWPYDPPAARRDIAGTFGEVRGEVMPEHDAWFHSGLDVPGAYGEVTRAVFGESVARPLSVDGVNTTRERLRLPLFGYIHVRIGRDANDRPLPGIEARGISFRRDERGAILGVRIRRGARFGAGDPIGTLNRLNHVHLVAGPSGAEVNAIAALILPGLTDTVPPVIEDVSLTDAQGTPLRREGPKGKETTIVDLTNGADGKARIIVRAYDQMDGNAGYRRLGLYRLGYQLFKADGAPAPGFEAPRQTIDFERLPSGPDAVARVYAEGSQSGYEGRTIFAFLATNQVKDGRAEEGFWETGALPPGEYRLRVFVTDYHNNQSKRETAVRIIKP